MSISLHSNAKILCTRFHHKFYQNLPSPHPFQLPDHLHFPPNYRLSAVVDHKRSSIVYCNKDGDSALSDGGDAFTCVMKFGGSSVALAERMREVATLIQCFPEEKPIIVLSAMGKTTNNLICVRYVKSSFTRFQFLSAVWVTELNCRLERRLWAADSPTCRRLRSWALSKTCILGYFYFGKLYATHKESLYTCFLRVSSTYCAVKKYTYHYFCLCFQNGERARNWCVCDFW